MLLFLTADYMVIGIYGTNPTGQLPVVASLKNRCQILDSMYSIDC